jgi:hypothetical protein
MLTNRFDADAAVTTLLISVLQTRWSNRYFIPSFISSRSLCQIRFIHRAGDRDAYYPTQATRTYRFVDVGSVWSVVVSSARFTLFS